METIKQIYYTEYPTGYFLAKDDEEAKKISKAMVIYRESETEDGTPFIMVRVSASE